MSGREEAIEKSKYMDAVRNSNPNEGAGGWSNSSKRAGLLDDSEKPKYAYQSNWKSWKNNDRNANDSNVKYTRMK